MRVYTIQHSDVYKNILKNGFYQTDTRFICEPDFLEAYTWLNNMGKKYIKNWFGSRPVWLWDKRPDLRKNRFISNRAEPKSQKFVLLTLEIPDDTILWSEFGLWHCVLNRSVVAYNNKEWNDLEKKLKKYDHLPFSKKPKNIQKLISSNWERILYLNPKSFKKFKPSWLGNIELQGITPEITQSQIVKAEFFQMINTYKNKNKR